jgi:hypothetical protein
MFATRLAVLLIRGISLMVAVAMVPGCTAAPTSGPDAVPAATAEVLCGDLDATFCASASQLVLRAVSGKIASPSRIELGRGVFCPTPGSLFDGGSCPAGAAPQWVGYALVSFTGSSTQAYIDLAQGSGGMTAVVLAFATPPPTVSPS